MVRVLFIDDDPREQDTRRWILAECYAVLPAGSAAEGLRLLHDQDPDVALLDIDLPDRDGLALLEDIVARPSAPHVRFDQPALRVGPRRHPPGPELRCSIFIS